MADPVTVGTVSITILVSSVAGTAAFMGAALAALWRWGCKREELFADKVEQLQREFTAALLDMAGKAADERDACRRSRKCINSPPGG